MSIETSGISFPDIPSDVLASYPYVFIYKITQGTDVGYGYIGSIAPCYYFDASITGMYSVLDPLSTTDYCDAQLADDGASWGTTSVYTNSEVAFPIGDLSELMGSQCIFEVCWSNYDILVAELNTDGNKIATSEIYYSYSTTFPSLYVVDNSWLKGIASQVRRLTDSTDNMSVDAILTNLMNIETSVKLNIAFGTTSPKDTNMLWIKTDETENLIVTPEDVSNSSVTDVLYIQTSATNNLFYLITGVFEIGVKNVYSISTDGTVGTVEAYLYDKDSATWTSILTD